MIQKLILDEKEQWLIEEEYLFSMADFSSFRILPLGTTRNIGAILGSISA